MRAPAEAEYNLEISRFAGGNSLISSGNVALSLFSFKRIFVFIYYINIYGRFLWIY